MLKLDAILKEQNVRFSLKRNKVEIYKPTEECIYFIAYL